MFGCTGCCREEKDRERANESEVSDIKLTHDDSSPMCTPKKDSSKEQTSPQSKATTAPKAQSPGVPVVTVKVVKAGDPPRQQVVSQVVPRNNDPPKKRIELGPSPQEKAAMAAKESDAMRKKGDEAFGHQDWDNAIKMYTEAIQINSQNTAALAGRAGVRVRRGDFRGAMPDLDEALKIDPQHLYALRDRAEAKSKLGDLDGALADYNAKLALAPGDGRALCGRGEVKLKKGDKQGAVVDLGLACQLTYPGADALLKKAKGA